MKIALPLAMVIGLLSCTSFLKNSGYADIKTKSDPINKPVDLNGHHAHDVEVLSTQENTLLLNIFLKEKGKLKSYQAVIVRPSHVYTKYTYIWTNYNTAEITLLDPNFDISEKFQISGKNNSTSLSWRDITSN